MVAQAFAADNQNITNPVINMEDDELEWSISEDASPTFEQIIAYDLLEAPEVTLKSAQR